MLVNKEMTGWNIIFAAVYISHTHQAKLSSRTSELFVLKVFLNRSISRPILILHLLHFEFITTFSLFLAESEKVCVPRGRPTRVLFPDIFFFDQQGNCGCAIFWVKEKVT